MPWSNKAPGSAQDRRTPLEGEAWRRRSGPRGLVLVRVLRWLICVIDAWCGCAYPGGMNTIDRLRQIPLFRHLSTERLEHLAQASDIQTLQRGRMLFRQGQPGSAFWVVVEGWVHLVRSGSVDGPGQGVVIFTITPDEVLCGLSTLETGRYSVSAIAATDGTAIQLPADLFKEALLREAEFSFQVLLLCARRIRHIAEQYGSMAEPVSHRVVRSILRLSQQFGSPMPVTHRELAQMSWTTTESAIRIVRRFKQEGALTGRRGELAIANRAQLERQLKNGHRSHTA